ncbi:MAG: hypothetical protein ACP6IY_11995 [Promethearchaeia archaeon]
MAKVKWLPRELVKFGFILIKVWCFRNFTIYKKRWAVISKKSKLFFFISSIIVSIS